MPQLRFTTLVEAPLTVAFDVARASERSWSTPLREVESVRPHSDVHVAAPPNGRTRLTATRRFTPTAEGTVVDERIDGASGLPGPLGLVADRVLRRRVERAGRSDLAGFVAAAEARARAVVQVVGAALVAGDRVLVAQRSGGPYDGFWEFPGGKVEPGESVVDCLRRELDEELGIVAEIGELVLTSVARYPGLEPIELSFFFADRFVGEPERRDYAEIRWVAPSELDALDFLDGDREILAVLTAVA